MPRRNLIIAAVAIAFGLLAVLIANSWFSGVEVKQERQARQQQLVRVAVANQNLGFGAQLTPEAVKLANWPADSVPAGAFTDLSKLVGNGRVVLRPLVPGEPILASKVSGLNGRATISANLPEGFRAIAVPINEVAGVGGFALPGDVVDVLVTRQIGGDGANGQEKMTTVVVENVQVLAIDQLADNSKTEPKVGKTATLQVTPVDAQKLALATQVGTLSLSLRNVQSQFETARTVVTTADLGGRGRAVGVRRAASPSAPAMALVPAAGARGGRNAAIIPASTGGPAMTIIRGTEPTQYEVKRYGTR